MEANAIAKGDFDDGEVAFLRDFYTTLYKGAGLLVVLSESSKMMEPYLERSGEPLLVAPSIFHTNRKVIHEMGKVEKEMASSPILHPSCRSPIFYMPDPSNVDSVFGLYYGHIEAKPLRKDGRIEVRWRAEVPWEWPSYDFLKQKHGDYHAESFPTPNITFFALGGKGAVYVDNGLGEYISRLGIAKPFNVYSEWTSTLEDQVSGE